MGGMGSGRQFGKLSVEDNLVLSLSTMLQGGQLTEDGSTQYLHWYQGDRHIEMFTVVISPTATGLHFLIQELHQHIFLSSTPLHFGGKRWWFHCPRCNRRCAKLSFSNGERGFYCRICLDLTYESCQGSHVMDLFYAKIAAKMSLQGERKTAREVAKECKNAFQPKRSKWKRKRDRIPSDGLDALDILYMAGFTR